MDCVNYVATILQRFCYFTSLHDREVATKRFNIKLFGNEMYCIPLQNLFFLLNNATLFFKNEPVAMVVELSRLYEREGNVTESGPNGGVSSSKMDCC